MLLASSSPFIPGTTTTITITTRRQRQHTRRGRRDVAAAPAIITASRHGSKREPPFAVPEGDEAFLEFYTHSLCPYAHRVSLCLAEKAVTHHRHHIDLSNKPGWYLKLNRRGLVPAVGLPSGEVLTESIDLCWWLEENFQTSDDHQHQHHHPSLVPADAGKEGEMRRLIDGFDGGFISAGLQYVGGGWGFSRGPPGERQASRMASEVELVRAVIAANGRGPYLMGADITLADLVLYPFAERFELAMREFQGYELGDMAAGGAGGRDDENLFAGWLRAMAERESCKSLRPDDDALLASWRGGRKSISHHHNYIVYWYTKTPRAHSLFRAHTIVYSTTQQRGVFALKKKKL